MFLAIAAVGTAPAQNRRIAPSSISPDRLRAHIKFLSDDLLEGRGTGARGGEIAARYIAAQFEALGMKGAGKDGSFFQPVSLVGVKADPKTELRINAADKAEAFKFADEFVAFTGAQTEHVSVDADMVFVGYGINAPEQNWNDYKGDAEDYRNKILVFLVNDPPATAAEPNLFGGRALTYYGRWTYKFEEAARRGAAGALLLHTDDSAGYPWSVVRTSNGSWRFDIARTAGDKTPFLKLRSWMTDASPYTRWPYSPGSLRRGTSRWSPPRWPRRSPRSARPPGSSRWARCGKAAGSFPKSTSPKTSEWPSSGAAWA